MDANRKDGMKHDGKGGVFAGNVTDIRSKRRLGKLEKNNGSVEHAAGKHWDEERKRRDKGNKDGEESRT